MTTTQTEDALQDFLQARQADDPEGFAVNAQATRVTYLNEDGTTVVWYWKSLRALASVYAGHPDYRDEWRADA